MTRRLLNLLTAASLLLCVAAVGMWVRSYTRSEWLVRDAERTSLRFASHPGTFHIHVQWGVTSAVPRKDPASRAEWWYDTYEPSPYFIKERQNGDTFYFSRGRFVVWKAVAAPASPGRKGWACPNYGTPAPYWLLVALAGALPAWRGGRWLLRRRRAGRPGHCAHCNYDLRATPERCPECGATAAFPPA